MPDEVCASLGGGARLTTMRPDAGNGHRGRRAEVAHRARRPQRARTATASMAATERHAERYARPRW